ncbi:hypothetical protein [Leptospira noguchii]|uniref:hypothetical protein n=1 Tax=Leptospira noguchii TaxID=28182 RepID=UPI0002FFF805|nr:hypothetical protein [Leptospira noguchii]
MERKELSKTLFTKAFETQHNAFLWVARSNSASRFYGRSTGLIWQFENFRVVLMSLNFYSSSHIFVKLKSRGHSKNSVSRSAGFETASISKY